MRDSENNITVVQAIGPVVAAADVTSAAVDLQGFDAATIIVQTGIGGITFTGTNKIEYVLTHSDDDSTYTAVAQIDVTDNVTVASNGIIRSLVAAHAAPTAVKVGYVGGKRYLKVMADFSGTHGTGTPLSVAIIKGRPNLLPQ